ncbi:glycosyltransferase family 2 protein [Patescibacteria group bacterium]|nr:glycosyltransferase family 2 protein [Patescibacteria group bacterium]MCL5798126.1 glycosyltransferase family 2 protein [Patescibacteria group bacterium]
MAAVKPSISVFFPFLNDWGTVGSLVGLTVDTVSRLADDWEVIIVNDGSDEKDKEALEKIVGVIEKQDKIKQKTKRIRIINHTKNMGYGGALRTGFMAAKKDLVFYTDCDAQYDPRELIKLYAAMKPGVSMVNGYKIKRQDPWVRIVAGRLYHYTVRTAFGLPIRDTDCDFRLIRTEVFNPSPGSGHSAVRLFENTGTICTELVKKIDHHGYKIVEVPVHHFWRTSGKSQFFNFRRLVQTGNNLFRLWWKLMVKNDYNS